MKYDIRLMNAEQAEKVAKFARSLGVAVESRPDHVLRTVDISTRVLNDIENRFHDAFHLVVSPVEESFQRSQGPSLRQRLEAMRQRTV